jgi:hypothetical protein
MEPNAVRVQGPGSWSDGTGETETVLKPQSALRDEKYQDVKEPPQRPGQPPGQAVSPDAERWTRLDRSHVGGRRRSSQWPYLAR